MKEVHQKDAVTLSIQLEGIPGKMHERTDKGGQQILQFKVQEGWKAGTSHGSPCSEERILDFLAFGGGGGGLTSRLLGNCGATSAEFLELLFS